MTLKEKFKQWLDTNPRLEIREVQLEVIADDYAIEFAEWCLKYRDKNKNIYGDILHSISKYDETYSTKELLEIFKKEYQEEINLFPIDSLEKQIAINQGKADDYAIEFAEWSVAKAMGLDSFKLNDNELEIFKIEKRL